MLSATTFQGYKKCCMLAMDVWCFSKSTARIDLEKHQTRLHYWGISLCNFGESPLQFWVFLLYTKQPQPLPEHFLNVLHNQSPGLHQFFLLYKSSFYQSSLQHNLIGHACIITSGAIITRSLPDGNHITRITLISDLIFSCKHKQCFIKIRVFT